MSQGAACDREKSRKRRDDELELSPRERQRRERARRLTGREHRVGDEDLVVGGEGVWELVQVLGGLSIAADARERASQRQVRGGGGGGTTSAAIREGRGDHSRAHLKGLLVPDETQVVGLRRWEDGLGAFQQDQAGSKDGNDLSRHRERGRRREEGRGTGQRASFWRGLGGRMLTLIGFSASTMLTSAIARGVSICVSTTGSHSLTAS